MFSGLQSPIPLTLARTLGRCFCGACMLTHSKPRIIPQWGCMWAGLEHAVVASRLVEWDMPLRGVLSLSFVTFEDPKCHSTKELPWEVLTSMLDAMQSTLGSKQVSALTFLHTVLPVSTRPWWAFAVHFPPGALQAWWCMH